MGQFKSIRNIFLDAGGVILDEEAQEGLHAELISALLRRMHSDYSIDQYWKDVEEAVQRFAPSTYDYVLWKNSAKIRLYNMLKAEHIEQWKNRRPSLKPMERLEAVVPAISERYRLGILGQYGDELKTLLARIGILEYFSYQSTQDGHQLSKPDPRYYQQILGEAGVSAAESLMVGDRIDKDIIPAKAVGMMTIRVVGGIHKNQRPRTPEESPDAEVHGLDELAEILLRQ